MTPFLATGNLTWPDAVGLIGILAFMVWVVWAMRG